MSHVLVVNGNPDPSPERLTSGLAQAYQEGAESAGGLVRRLNLGSMEFPWLRSTAEFASEPVEQTIVEARRDLLWAEHVVFVFPLWLGGPPALLKALLEQVARGQFALRENKGGFPIGGLKGRSARVIVTMGMPPLLYRTLYGAHGVKAFNRSILGIAGFSPVRTSYFGGSAIIPPRSARLIEQVRDMGRRHA